MASSSSSSSSSSANLANLASAGDGAGAQEQPNALVRHPAQSNASPSPDHNAESPDLADSHEDANEYLAAVDTDTEDPEFDTNMEDDVRLFVMEGAVGGRSRSGPWVAQKSALAFRENEKKKMTEDDWKDLVFKLLNRVNALEQKSEKLDDQLNMYKERIKTLESQPTHQQRPQTTSSPHLGTVLRMNNAAARSTPPFYSSRLSPFARMANAPPVQFPLVHRPVHREAPRVHSGKHACLEHQDEDDEDEEDEDDSETRNAFEAAVCSPPSAFDSNPSPMMFVGRSPQNTMPETPYSTLSFPPELEVGVLDGQSKFVTNRIKQAIAKYVQFYEYGQDMELNHPEVVKKLVDYLVSYEKRCDAIRHHVEHIRYEADNERVVQWSDNENELFPVLPAISCTELGDRPLDCLEGDEHKCVKCNTNKVCLSCTGCQQKVCFECSVNEKPLPLGVPIRKDAPWYCNRNEHCHVSDLILWLGSDVLQNPHPATFQCFLCKEDRSVDLVWNRRCGCIGDDKRICRVCVHQMVLNRQNPDFIKCPFGCPGEYFQFPMHNGEMELVNNMPRSTDSDDDFPDDGEENDDDDDDEWNRVRRAARFPRIRRNAAQQREEEQMQQQRLASAESYIVEYNVTGEEAVSILQEARGVEPVEGAEYDPEDATNALMGINGRGERGKQQRNNRYQKYTTRKREQSSSSDNDSDHDNKNPVVVATPVATPVGSTNATLQGQNAVASSSSSSAGAPCRPPVLASPCPRSTFDRSKVEQERQKQLANAQLPQPALADDASKERKKKKKKKRKKEENKEENKEDKKKKKKEEKTTFEYPDDVTEANLVETRFGTNGASSSDDFGDPEFSFFLDSEEEET